MSSAENIHPVAHTRHSLLLSETFIFTLITATTAIALSLWFTRGFWMEASEEQRRAVAHAAKFLTHSAEQILSEGEAVGKAAIRRPVPYLKQLPDLLPYLKASLPYVKIILVDWPYAMLSALLAILWVPLRGLLALLLRLFSPVTLLLQILFGIFVATPYKAAVWLGRLLYPIYVFCGVACLVGALFGLAGAGIGWLGLAFVATQKSGETGDMETLPRGRVDLKGKQKETVSFGSWEGSERKRGRKVEFAT